MSKMKFGAIIVDGRNKIGGHVLAKNKAGNYMRTKVTPTNPRTTAQLGVRNTFKSLSQGWRSLTEAQRAAWNNAVNDFKKTDIFGDLKTPSGFNLYKMLNGNLSTVGSAPVLVPPLPTGAIGCDVSGLTVEITPDLVSIATETAVATGMKGIVSMTPPMSAGKSFVKSDFRIVAIILPAGGTSHDVTSDYVAKFGAVGKAGQKIFVQVATVNTTTGEKSGYSQFSGIVAVHV